MNIKTPFRKLHKHTLPFYLLLFLFLSNYVLNVSFVLYDTVKFRLDLAIVFLVLGLIVGLLFLICKISNPGILKPSTYITNTYQILLKNKPHDICFDCKIVKPQRSRHCQICESCICVYDHHCPWIANCVGANNYLIFFIFLISMLTFMVFTIAFEIINLIETDWKQFHTLDFIRVVCQIYSLTICVLFLLPLIFLIIVQSKNTIQNKTTFERYAYQKQVGSPSTQKQSQSMSNFSSEQKQKIRKGSNASEQLRMKLLDHQSSENTLRKPMEIEGEGQLDIRNSERRNCYMMCLGNKNNIRYQVAV